jgi:hypothetical protein
LIVSVDHETISVPARAADVVICCIIATSKDHGATASAAC